MKNFDFSLLITTLIITKINKMFNFISIILFISIIIFHHFLIPSSDAIKPVEDKMLIAFMKGQQQFQISKYSKQNYVAYLGIMYFMRGNWQCDKIAKELEEFERTECQKYRKYLDILYEYLFREYAGIPTVKPKFVFKRKHFKNEIEIDGPIIYAVICLAKIFQFYFNNAYYGYKLNIFFSSFKYKPKLMNEEKLNYELKLENERKMPINEMILELAIDTANEYKTNENLEGIIRQNFDKNLNEMLKKAKKNKEHSYLIIDINFGPKSFDSRFAYTNSWYADALFCEFVKGIATNFEKFSKLTKNRAEHLSQKYESILGFSYFMKNNLQCDKIVGDFRGTLCKKCQKTRKYLQIMFEYLFRLYAEGKNAEFANKLAAVKPMFRDGHRQYYKSLAFAGQILNNNSKYFLKKSGKNLDFYNELRELHLENEEELLNDEINEDIVEALRREFEQKIEKMSESAKNEMADFFKK